MNRERDWECKSRVKENETKWEKKKMRYECVRQTKRNEPRAYEFFKTTIVSRTQQVFLPISAKIDTINNGVASFHPFGRKKKSRFTGDRFNAGKQKAGGRAIFSRHKSGEEGGGGQRGPITSVQVFSRTKGGEKKERTWKVARNSEARPDASGFRK